MGREYVGPLAPAEWKVMQLAWRLKKFAARDIYVETERLYGWAPTTTKAVLTRLVAKGYLSTTLVGNSFLYRTSKSALKTLTDAADALLGQFLKGTSGPVLAHLVRRSKLSADELAELKALIDEQAKQADRDQPRPKVKGE